MNKVAPLVCIPVGLYWIIMGISKYGLWISDGPGGGLFPVLCGLLLIGCGSVLLCRAAKSKEKFFFDRRVFQLVASALAAVLGIYLIGMIPALGIFILLWLRFFEKQPLVKSLAIGAGMALFLFLVFGIALKVPLPLGLLGRI
ncbi:MAG: tripartite tricarboxylate transporter TctB family protein [Spirochaetales bacterium]|jgi:hypothetical protein|nr:tripartite tricarboxylate transporter TctB family protein [Spirochaetales bacterium]